MTDVAVDVNRGQVLAYRVAAQQLSRVDAKPAALAVLDLGVQDTPYGSARLALAARTSRPPADEALVLAWSTRGAPHLHRPADLPRLTAALWPLTDADATARIASTQIKEGARLGLAAFTAVARALREVVTTTLSKGEVSTGTITPFEPLPTTVRPIVEAEAVRLATVRGAANLRVLID